MRIKGFGIRISTKYISFTPFWQKIIFFEPNFSTQDLAVI